MGDIAYWGNGGAVAIFFGRDIQGIVDNLAPELSGSRVRSIVNAIQPNPATGCRRPSSAKGGRSGWP